MKKAHFTDSQILAIFKQAESGVPDVNMVWATQPFIMAFKIWQHECTFNNTNERA